jgi:hypothetical protein
VQSSFKDFKAIVHLVGFLFIVDEEFCSKNKFEKFVHLVGFTSIIRIYYDARSFECQKSGL